MDHILYLQVWFWESKSQQKLPNCLGRFRPSIEC